MSSFSRATRKQQEVIFQMLSQKHEDLLECRKNFLNHYGGTSQQRARKSMIERYSSMSSFHDALKQKKEEDEEEDDDDDFEYNTNPGNRNSTKESTKNSQQKKTKSASKNIQHLIISQNQAAKIRKNAQRHFTKQSRTKKSNNNSAHERRVFFDEILYTVFFVLGVMNYLYVTSTEQNSYTGLPSNDASNTTNATNATNTSMSSPSSSLTRNFKMKAMSKGQEFPLYIIVITYVLLTGTFCSLIRRYTCCGSLTNVDRTILKEVCSDPIVCMLTIVGLLVIGK